MLVKRGWSLFNVIPSDWDLETGGPRAPKAVRSLSGVLECQKVNLRWIRMLYLFQRLTPLAVPLALKSYLDPLLRREDVVFLGWSMAAEIALSGLIGLVIVCCLTQSACLAWTKAISARTGHEVVADLRKLVVDQLLRLPASYTERRGLGRIILRFVGDSDALRLWISRHGPFATVDQLLVALLIVLLLLIDPVLAVAVAAPILAIGWVSMRCRGTIVSQTMRARDLQSRMTSVMDVCLFHIRQSKWLSSQKPFRRFLVQAISEVAQSNRRRDKTAALLEGGATAISATSIAVGLWIGMYRVWNLSLGPGVLVAVVWISFQLYSTINRLIAASFLYQKSTVSVKRILKLLSRRAERGRVSNVKNRLIRGKSLTISIRKKEAMIIPGPGVYSLNSDISKALLDGFLGFDEPKSIEIQLDEADLSTIDVICRRDLVGWVSANPMTFRETVSNNLWVEPGIWDSLPPFERKLLQNLHGCKKDFMEWLMRRVESHKLLEPEEASDRMLISLTRCLVRCPKIYFVDHQLATVIPLHILQELGSSRIVILEGLKSSPAQARSGDLGHREESP